MLIVFNRYTNDGLGKFLQKLLGQEIVGRVMTPLSHQQFIVWYFSSWTSVPLLELCGFSGKVEKRALVQMSPALSVHLCLPQALRPSVQVTFFNSWLVLIQSGSDENCFHQRILEWITWENVQACYSLLYIAKICIILKNFYCWVQQAKVKTAVDNKVKGAYEKISLGLILGNRFIIRIVI